MRASLSVLAKAVSLHSGRTCRLLLVSYSPWTRQLVTVLATCTCRSVSPLHGHISMLSTVLKADRCRRVTYASGARSVHSNCFPCSPTLQHTLGTRWCHMARFNVATHPGYKMVPHGTVQPWTTPWVKDGATWLCCLSLTSRGSLFFHFVNSATCHG